MEFEEERPSWSDVIRAERENVGHSILTWEIMAEGAIVSVSEGPSCAGVWVYLFGGPEKPESSKDLFYMLEADFKSITFPQLRAFHSCPSKNEYAEVVQNPETWIQQGKDFIYAIRNLPRE